MVLRENLGLNFTSCEREESGHEKRTFIKEKQEEWGQEKERPERNE